MSRSVTTRGERLEAHESIGHVDKREEHLKQRKELLERPEVWRCEGIEDLKRRSLRRE